MCMHLEHIQWMHWLLYFIKGRHKYTSKYKDALLSEILGIKSGDVYDVSRLESGLFMSINGTDISSLYLDDGYLFFNATPVEIAVTDRKIDLEKDPNTDEYKPKE